jgi:hypothetical protein
LQRTLKQVNYSVQCRNDGGTMDKGEEKDIDDANITLTFRQKLIKDALVVTGTLSLALGIYRFCLLHPFSCLLLIVMQGVQKTIQMVNEQ